MNLKKFTLWALPIAVIVCLAIVSYFNQNSTQDPAKDFIQENNYPYNGYYSENSISISENELATILTQDQNISNHAENISVEIQEDNTVVFHCKLKEVEQLFASSEELSAFKTWATAFNEQNLTVNFSVTADENDNALIQPTAISVGEITLDPQIITPLIAGDNFSKLMGDIPYNSIGFADGSISFSQGLPKFLQQQQ